MSTIPALTKEAVRERFGETVYRYVDDLRREELVSGRERIGMTLLASCPGINARDWDARATFDHDDICDAFCTCPMGDDGYCRHVAALLLAWINTPQEFDELEPVEPDPDSPPPRRPWDPDREAFEQELLGERSAMERVAEARGRYDPCVPPDPGVWRRRVAAVFWKHGYDEYGERQIAEELAALRATADLLVDQHYYSGAVVIYEAVTAAAIENHDLFESELEHLPPLVWSCTVGLGRCLAGLPADAGTRAIIWRIFLILFDADRTDAEFLFSKGIRELAQQYATATERHAIASRLNDLVGGDWSEDERLSVTSFFLEMEGDAIDDRSYVSICSRSCHCPDAVERLLEMGRLPEAIRTAEAAGDGQMLEIADLFVRCCYPRVAEQLLRDRARTTMNARLLRWAIRYHEARGEALVVLELTRRLFRRQPTVEGCRDLCRLAHELGRWEELCCELMDFLHLHQQYSLMWQTLELDSHIINEMLRIVDTFRAAPRRRRR